jgi:hypothetical protein
MKRRSFWTYLPPGPLLSLLLVGLVLLSGLLYYRAVRIQRFLEPALALSQPRNDFSEAIAQVVEKEFGKGRFPGLDVRTSAIIVDQALLVTYDGRRHTVNRAVLQKLSRVFQTLLEDKRTRADISLVLISAGYPPGGAPAAEAAERSAVERMLGDVLDGLFAAEPVLKANYRTFFATTARPAPPREGYPALMEFRIIPSEMLHMDVLLRLQKYAQ